MPIVICLEGCHGCGKTEVRKRLASSGFVTLDEGFLDAETGGGLHPQSLVMETMWVTEWFKRVIATCQKDSVCFIDRSPYSAVVYAKEKKGRILKILIDDMIQELEKDTDIVIRTVHLKVQEKVLWKRIQDRLTREPERTLYNEDSDQWMRDVSAFYNQFKEWDHTVKNDCNIDNTCDKILSIFNLNN